MFNLVKSKTIIAILILTILLSACGGNATQDPSISTAVAQTVAAQNVSVATETPLTAPSAEVTQGPLQFIPTLTPLVPMASVTPAQATASAKTECGQASMISETVPDGAIYAPKTPFTKTWEIKNTSNCTWDTNYKIIFFDGEIMGGGYYYNLPQVVPPGATFPLSLVLKAPETDGTYTSKWMLQTPDGANFGVGQYSVALSAQIVVDSSTKPKYSIISVDYKVVRDPPTGCPANTRYTIYATLTSDGPLKVTLQWLQGSGTPETELLRPPVVLTFTKAESQTISHDALLHLGATPGNQRWKAIVITDPYYQEFYHVNYNYDCGDY
ncbi:MAG: hypothetical protein IT310_12845 [Anaerolineales bacterium]|nr:hypothetical protein [Anaerolineales bacterium]